MKRVEWRGVVGVVNVVADEGRDDVGKDGGDRAGKGEYDALADVIAAGWSERAWEDREFVIGGLNMATGVRRQVGKV